MTKPRPRLSMKLLWKRVPEYYAHIGMPWVKTSEVTDFLDFLDEQMKLAKPRTKIASKKSPTNQTNT